MNKVIYPIVAVMALMILHSYASSGIVQLTTQGSYFSGLVQAFMGGYGNTIPALAALICSILGILRNLLSAKGGFGAILSGKIIGLVNTIITVIAVFGNGVLAYLKFSDGGGIINISGRLRSIVDVVSVKLVCNGVLIEEVFLKANKR